MPDAPKASGSSGSKHDGELGKVEAADENERSGAELSGMGAGMGEGVANLAQHHQPEGWRQIEGARIGLADPAALLQRHFDYGLTFDLLNNIASVAVSPIGASRLTGK